MRLSNSTRVIVLLFAAGVVKPMLAQSVDSVVAPANYVESGGSDPISSDQSGLVRELMRRRGGDPAASAHLIQLTREFPPRSAAEMFDELARAHQAVGNLDLAAETRRLLVEKYPDEPLAAATKLWLVRLYASSEAAHAHRRRDFGASWKNVDDLDESQGRAKYALHLAGAAERDTGRTVDPALDFQRAVAVRLAGAAQASRSLLTPLKHARAGDPWGDCARAEAWLEDRHKTPPKPVLSCLAAAEPPHLDGVLDELFWQSAASRLSAPASAGSAPPPAAQAADVRWAYDDEYLYLAIRCSKLSGVAYPRDNRPRPHDGDVENYDRVRLFIDVDRDYATWFELTVDSRGWTSDRAWDDAAWNPPWFVSAGAGNGDAGVNYWTIEAAIPLDELTPQRPGPMAAWAAAVERVSPSVHGAERPRSETQPGPEAFGLLLFE
jgi:hypothetical protein